MERQQALVEENEWGMGDELRREKQRKRVFLTSLKATRTWMRE